MKVAIARVTDAFREVFRVFRFADDNEYGRKVNALQHEEGARIELLGTADGVSVEPHPRRFTPHQDASTKDRPAFFIYHHKTEISVGCEHEDTTHLMEQIEHSFIREEDTERYMGCYMTRLECPVCHKTIMLSADHIRY